MMGVAQRSTRKPGGKSGVSGAEPGRDGDDTPAAGCRVATAGRRAILGAAALLFIALLTGGLPGRAAEATVPPAPPPDPQVDLLLVLAIDASASITGGDMEFQLRGHAAAFRSAQLRQAVGSGLHGAIAVTAMQWAGPNTAEVLVPWTRLATPADADAFAAALDHAARPARIDSTAIGSALRAAAHRFADSPWPGERRVIDLCSNGFSNSGPDPAVVRDQVTAGGITVNALAILDEYDWLENYYRDNVIGGPGAFVRTADGRDSFAEAILQKLAAEIAGVAPPARSLAALPVMP